MENEEEKAAFRKEDGALENKSLKKKAKIDDLQGEYDQRFAGPHTKGLCASDFKRQLHEKRHPNGPPYVPFPRFTSNRYYPHYDREKSKSLKRFFRNHETSLFRNTYKYVKGRKICISSEIDTGSTGPFCYASSWVAVHGLDSICMVTLRKAVDIRRVPDYCYISRTEKEALPKFSEAVISEVECIPYNDFPYNHDILRELCSGKVVMPFGVVSLVMNTGKNSKEVLYSKKAERSVCEFLKQKMKDSGSTCTHYKTIQTAIDAFQHMCHGQELKAEDIWVTILDVEYGCFDHLNLDTRKEQLDIVNGCLDPTRSPLKPLFVSRGPPL